MDDLLGSPDVRYPKADNILIRVSGMLKIAIDLHFTTEIPEHGSEHDPDEGGEDKTYCCVRRVSPVRQTLFP